MKIENHLLKGQDIIQKESPNRGTTFKEGHPDTIVIHYTAGSTAESAVKTLCNPKHKASAHLVVGRDKHIWQLVPFNTVAWHAGKSSYAGRNGYNKYSIGIEIDNAGFLTEQMDGSYSTWFGKKIQDNEVITEIHRNETEPRYWHRYTEQQIKDVFDICEYLYNTYPIKYILGHEEIAPGRKTDPGPAFPLDKLRQTIFIHDRNEEGALELPENGVVNASQLNIRTGPDTSNPKAGPPLTQGDKVKIIQESNGWYEVEIVAKGWVSKDYIKT